MRLCIIFLASLFPLASFALEPTATTAPDKGKAERVVMMVWDGMRPDMISREQTPTLFALMQRGVFFKKHHAAYVSSTEVNATELATGVYPARSGIMANKEYRPEIDPLKMFNTQAFNVTRKADAAGKYLGAATVAEILQGAGFPTAVAGSKSVALLHDRSPKRDSGAAKDSRVFFEGKMLPDSEIKEAEAKLGPFPVTIAVPNTPQDAWTTKLLTEVFWKDETPKFSVLWLSEPDYSQHGTAPGSSAALAAMKSSDDQLATVLAALTARGLADSTDIFVVSDHGFSTISRSVDVPTLLSEAGFAVSREKFTEPPQHADILAVGNGGEISFYVIGHAENTVEQLVQFLQQSDFAGVIFSRAEIEGTFRLDQARLNTKSAPDVVMSFRWSADKNKFGVPGMIFADWNRKAGAGTHATLSPFEMHNTLVAAGPDFRKGETDTTPSGNVDLAPTILWILGVKPPEPMDGRVLFEAMTATGKASPRVTEGRSEATRDFDDARWKQYLKWSQVNDTIYFDEGNGAGAGE